MLSAIGNLNEGTNDINILLKVSIIILYMKYLDMEHIENLTSNNGTFPKLRFAFKIV